MEIPAKNSVPGTGMRINPICRRFLPGSAVGAKFEVVVRVSFAIEVTLRHHRVAFQAKVFVSHRRSPSAYLLQAALWPGHSFIYHKGRFDRSISAPR